jgi:hypothetical protein
MAVETALFAAKGMLLLAPFLSPDGHSALMVHYRLFRAGLVQSHQSHIKSLMLLWRPKSPNLLGHEWDKISGRSKLPLPLVSSGSEYRPAWSMPEGVGHGPAAQLDGRRRCFGEI